MRQPQTTSAITMATLYQDVDPTIDRQSLRALTPENIEGFLAYLRSLRHNDDATKNAALEAIRFSAEAMDDGDFFDLLRHCTSSRAYGLRDAPGQDLVHQMVGMLQDGLQRRLDAVQRERAERRVRALRTELKRHAPWLVVEMLAATLAMCIFTFQLMMHSLIISLLLLFLLVPVGSFFPIHLSGVSLMLQAIKETYHEQGERLRRFQERISWFVNLPLEPAEREPAEALRHAMEDLDRVYLDFSRVQREPGGDRRLPWSGLAAIKEALWLLAQPLTEGDDAERRYVGAQKLWLLSQSVVPPTRLRRWFETSLVHGDGDPATLLPRLVGEPHFSRRGMTQLFPSKFLFGTLEVPLVGSMFEVYCSFPSNRGQGTCAVLTSFLRAWPWSDSLGDVRGDDLDMFQDRLKQDLKVMVALLLYVEEGDGALEVIAQAFCEHLVPKFHELSFGRAWGLYQASLELFPAERLGWEPEAARARVEALWASSPYLPQDPSTLSLLPWRTVHAEAVPAGLAACAQDPVIRWVFGRLSSVSMSLRLARGLDDEEEIINVLRLDGRSYDGPGSSADGGAMLDSRLRLSRYVQVRCHPSQQNRAAHVSSLLETWLFLRAAAIVAEQWLRDAPSEEQGGQSTSLDHVLTLFQGLGDQLLRALQDMCLARSVPSSHTADRSSLRTEVAQFFGCRLVEDTAVSDTVTYAHVHWLHQDLERLGRSEVLEVLQFRPTDHHHPVDMGFWFLRHLVDEGPVDLEADGVAAVRAAPFRDTCLALGLAWCATSSSTAGFVPEGGQATPPTESREDADVEGTSGGAGSDHPGASSGLDKEGMGEGGIGGPSKGLLSKIAEQPSDAPLSSAASARRTLRPATTDPADRSILGPQDASAADDHRLRGADSRTLGLRLMSEDLVPARPSAAAVPGVRRLSTEDTMSERYRTLLLQLLVSERAPR